MRKGNLFVISGPSGAGKGTLVARIVNEIPDAWVSVSATTRTPRDGERDGVNYYFVEKPDFLRMVDEGGFLEWAEYAGNCYGTPLESVRRKIDEGKQVILEIDVQGAFQVRDKVPDAKLVFIEPPSFEELERRLRSRGTESEDAVSRRLDAARLELSRKEEYDIQLVNDDLEVAVKELAAYIDEQAQDTRG